MADFTALKNSIRNYIKQNGNSEITGEVLQNILISMVVSMGDGAINGIADGLANEGNARTNADGLLQNAINSISAALGDGYTYAGIATPATTPASGRVFYLALQAGTYTNFGGLVVTQGINILKNNNGTWQLDNVIGIDDVPTAGSEKLVTSGGVFANIGAFDISDYNKSGSTLATYADLTAALAALPSEYQKGGMSVKFVQSSDNKYVQYQYIGTDVTGNPNPFLDITNWQKVNSVDKIKISSGVNLIDTTKFIAGKGINPNNGKLNTNVDLNVSDFIPVNESDIISNSYATEYWGGAVYDAERNWLRGLTTTQYEYQDGDAYIRLSYLATATKPSANYGTVLLAYRPYNPAGAYIPSETNELSTTQDIVFRRGILNGDGTIRYTSINKTLISSPIYGNKNIILPSDCVVSRINYYNATDDTFISSTYLSSVGSYNVVCSDGVYAIINIAKVDSSDISPEEINQSLVLTKLGEEVSDNSYHITTIEDALKNPIEGYTVGEYWLNSGGKSVIVPINEGDNILLRSTSQISYGFLTDFKPNWLHFTPMPWVSGSLIIGNSNHNIELSAPATAKYLYITVYKNNSDVSPNIFKINGYDFTESLRDNIGSLREKNTYDIAGGSKQSFGKSESSKEACCLINEASKNYVDYHTISNKGKRDYHNERIVAINFDDLAKNDYIGTRKILNKYGFNATFNFILKPFSSITEMNEMVANVKRLVQDGNDLGLHAIMQESFWMMNKMFDLRPDFETSFAPTLAETKTIVADGKNVFGYTLTSTTKFADAGFVNPPSSLANTNVVDATGSDYLTLIANYCLYYMSDSISGVDLDGNVVTKTALQWLEYWYNGLINPTLGYSVNNSSVAAKYADDYEFPEGGTAAQYYPEANHLLSGRMVFFDDIWNDHYSEAMTSDSAGFDDSKWQLVGRFKKGLFKGCASCCNYEVIDRCIDIATAFIRYYFGVEGFTNFGRHGVRYADTLWRSDDGVPYDNRTKTVISGEVGKFYQSRTGCFVNAFDILLSKGIKMTNHTTPIEPIFESQTGLYFGQENVRYPFFNHVFGNGGAINYLALFGTSPSGFSESMDYETFISYMGFRNNWLKFAYENGGQTIHKIDGSGSMYMFYLLRNFINIIRGCLGTGKIPVFSLDTIKVNAATLCATELLCQYCYANDIDIVPIEYARKIANSKREYRRNWFPNPNFSQSVLNILGGSSTEKRAYMPDGWYLDYSQNNTQIFEVLTNEVQNKRVLKIDAPDIAYYDVSMYGLPAGTYKLSYYAKKTKGTSVIRLFRKKNSDHLTQYYNGQTMFLAEDSYIVSTDWVLHEYEFTIDEPYRGQDDNTVVNQYSRGYENNVVRMMLQIQVNDNSDILLHSPKVERI